MIFLTSPLRQTVHFITAILSKYEEILIVRLVKIEVFGGARGHVSPKYSSEGPDIVYK